MDLYNFTGFKRIEELYNLKYPKLSLPIRTLEILQSKYMDYASVLFEGTYRSPFLCVFVRHGLNEDFIPTEHTVNELINTIQTSLSDSTILYTLDRVLMDLNPDYKERIAKTHDQYNLNSLQVMALLRIYWLTRAIEEYEVMDCIKYYKTKFKFPEIKLPYWVLMELRESIHKRNNDHEHLDYLCVYVQYTYDLPECIKVHETDIRMALNCSVENRLQDGTTNPCLSAKIIDMNPAEFRNPRRSVWETAYNDNYGDVYALRIAWLEVEIERIERELADFNFKHIVFPKLDLDASMISKLLRAYKKFIGKKPSMDNLYHICVMLGDKLFINDKNDYCLLLKAVQKAVGSKNNTLYAETKCLNNGIELDLNDDHSEHPFHPMLRLYWLESELKRTRGKAEEIPQLTYRSWS